ncbi:hypothetical protein Undi14_00840 [Undibacterium sp. 14-3-2]|nr:hypothetical protein [Undibacterium sp. 14-3-2]MBK1888560.1 hypothetical protein [Undibacterium sp. 14-3-2]
MMIMMKLRQILLKLSLILLLLLVLAVAFLAYLQPGFVLDLANRFVLC